MQVRMIRVAAVHDWHHMQVLLLDDWIRDRIASATGGWGVGGSGEQCGAYPTHSAPLGPPCGRAFLG